MNSMKLMFKQVAISCLFRSPMIIIIISRIINPFELNYFDHIYIYIYKTSKRH